MDDRDRQEQDRKERDRATGEPSSLGPDVCQYCGSPSGTIVIWTNPEDIADDAHTLEPCPVCNQNT